MRFIMMLIVLAGLTSTAMGNPWKFAVMADSDIIDGDDGVPLGSSEDILGTLVGDLKHQDIDFVIFPGDLAMRDGNDSLDEILGLWRSQVKPLYDAGIEVYTIRGNHDRVIDEPLPGSDPYLKYFTLPRNATSPDGGYTYSFSHRNANFIGFDQYLNRKASFDDHLYALHSNQGQMMNPWVISQIDSSTSPLNFVFSHEPLFASKSHSNCMANDPDSRDALVAALSAHHGAYFCGHDHMYLRGTASDGQEHAVPEFVVGTAGGRIYDYAPVRVSDYEGPDTFSVEKVYDDSTELRFGYLLVTVNDDNTWTGQFRGFQQDSTNATRGIKTLDSFVVGLENDSQTVS